MVFLKIALGILQLFLDKNVPSPPPCKETHFFGTFSRRLEKKEYLHLHLNSV